MVAKKLGMRFSGLSAALRHVRAAVLLAAALSPASAQPVPEDRATPQQRADLVAVERFLCNSARRPVVRPSSPLLDYYVKRLSAAKSTVEVLQVSNMALDVALNDLGEGETAQAWNLVCAVLDARMRVLGAAAPRTVVVFNNFSVLLRKQGFVADARRILQQLEPIVRNYPKQGAELTRTVLHNLGTTLIFQGYHEQAETTLRRSLSYAGPATDTTPTLTNIARTLEARDKWKEAETLHREVLRKRRTRATLEPFELSATLNNLGANLTSQGLARDGEAFIREGLRIRSRLEPGHLNIGYSLATLVHNLLEQGKAREATPLAAELLDLRRRALGATHSETSEAHRLMAETAIKLGAPNQALASARAALETSLSLLARETSGLDDEAKVVVRRESSNAAFTLASAAWHATTQPASGAQTTAALLSEAFLAGQRVSTSSTFEALLSANARQAATGKGSGSLADEFEAQLVARARLDAALAGAAAKGAPLTGLQLELARLVQQQDSTARRLRAAFPAYFDLIRAEPVSAKSIATLLRDDEALVLITPGVGREQGFVWALTRNDARWAPVQMTADKLGKAVTGFRRVLDPGNSGTADDGPATGADWTKGNELYKALFGNPRIATMLAAKPHWILAPQGVLMSLPFNALLSAPPGEKLPVWPSAPTLRGMRWLGLEKTLSLVPSVGSLRVLRALPEGPRAGQPFFGVGDPYFPDSKVGRLVDMRSTRAISASDLETLRQLDPLPGTRVEIESLAKMLKAPRRAYLLGQEANESEFVRRANAGQILDARIIAFATHGLMGGELGESAAEPAIVLSPPLNVSAANDGLLTASEIRTMKLRAEWVLLSACNTAAGSRVGAEGLTGLARSFLYAGARSLLISNWRVRDNVAPRLVGRALALAQEAGAAGAPARASAIRQSMREIMLDISEDEGEPENTRAHPRAWAAYTFIGVN